MTEGRTVGGSLAGLLGLLTLSLLLAVGQPFILIAVAFAMLTFLARGGGILTLLIAAGLFASVFAGEPSGSLWYLERGWAIVLAGWFVALSLLLPTQPFLGRALPALLASVLCVAALLLPLDGWAWVESLVMDRVETGAAATLELVDLVTEGDLPAEISTTLAMTVRMQRVLFPALLGLSSLASLGVAWWLHVRVSPVAGPALSPLKQFRFADPLIWILISGIGLLLVSEWSVGWGRLGTNLATFMGALYLLRGVAVLLVLLGSLSVAGGILLALALVVAGPLVAMGTILVGVGDSWMDLRARYATRKNAPG